MATRLDKIIKRELELDGRLYTVSISPEGIKVVPKGGRKGHEVSWESLLSGEAELRRDLSMSLEVTVRSALRRRVGPCRGGFLRCAPNLGERRWIELRGRPPRHWRAEPTARTLR